MIRLEQYARLECVCAVSVLNGREEFLENVYFFFELYNNGLISGKCGLKSLHNFLLSQKLCEVYCCYYKGLGKI